MATAWMRQPLFCLIGSGFGHPLTSVWRTLVDEHALMRLGVLLDSAAGSEYLLKQISVAMEQSVKEMSRLRNEWVEKLGIDPAQMTDHLREFHKAARKDSAVGFVAQLDCELAQFHDRHKAASRGESALLDAVILTYANARITALMLRTFDSAEWRHEQPH